MRTPALPILALLQEKPEESVKTTNYRGQLEGFSNVNWGYVVGGGFVLLLLLLIRRAFRRM
ncbi:MAG: hypothetical protein HY823_05305 [Acidobacteria bacterium]|nr:hypothetical protein [Acidobacteriota bacterium]